MRDRIGPILVLTHHTSHTPDSITRKFKGQLMIRTQAFFDCLLNPRGQESPQHNDEYKHKNDSEVYIPLQQNNVLISQLL